MIVLFELSSRFLPLVFLVRTEEWGSRDAVTSGAKTKMRLRIGLIGQQYNEF